MNLQSLKIYHYFLIILIAVIVSGCSSAAVLSEKRFEQNIKILTGTRSPSEPAEKIRTFTEKGSRTDTTPFSIANYFAIVYANKAIEEGLSNITVCVHIDSKTAPIYNTSYTTTYGSKTPVRYYTYESGKKTTYICEISYWKDKTETLTYPDGSKYVGQVKDGKAHGQGTRTYTDGRKYAGKWKDGKMYAGSYEQGMMIWPDGRKYIGAWENDEKHGQGTDYDSKGNLLRKGTFRKGWFTTK